MKIRERRCDACDALIKGSRFRFKTKGWERDRYGIDNHYGLRMWPRRIELCEECWNLLPNFMFERRGDRQEAK